ncbi:hypothetical protein J1N35_037766 [Gossypium stocksii]|uniref:Uncharacterized protein n=1 Tax=Gossypium stocksii TaxID=47602 RepID=A0A9D3ZM35_9ROSI|nr:hypothetical protein J1N35_037766 [Gossypium stocksii]
MVKTMGSGHINLDNSPRQQELLNVIERKSYICTTKEEEMFHALATRGIRISNFAYDFSIPEGLHCLRDTYEDDELTLILLGLKVEPNNYFYSFCKLKPLPWSLQLPMHEQTSVSTVMLTVGGDVRIVDGAGTAQGTEDSSKESISLSREIDKYIDVHLYMQSVLGGPFGTSTDRGNVNTRKRQRIVVGTTNITLICEDEGSDNPTLKETRRLFCTDVSSSDARRPSLRKLAVSLQVLLNEACMASKGLVKGVDQANTQDGS